MTCVELAVQRPRAPPSSKSRRWLRRFLVFLALLALTLAAIRLSPHPPLWAGQPQSVAVYDRHGKLLRLGLASDDRYRLWVPLAEFSPALIEGVLLHEDAWFRAHPGFNPVSLIRGAWSTYASGEARVGGSTLTMQLARLRGRLSTRTPGGKLRQLAHALALEACYSKDQILEAYLNLAPYGGNIEGAGAASLIYFNKAVAQLTLPEALTLAVLPQAPARRGRLAAGAEGAQIGPALRAARDRLYARYRQAHPLDSSNDALISLPLRLRAARELPFQAPHFVERVLAERWRRGGGEVQLISSLDLELQRLLERRVAAHIARMRARGLKNAAALLIDTRDMGVRALVGSADYFDASISGQVNGTAAKRSPGSTLKPFIYGLAVDQGVLHPATVLRDVPSAFGRFMPENFDGRFLGPVTATDALVRSRNIPAVYVAAQLSNPSFYEFLRRAGISEMASHEHYGLALVLGGGEVTMEELARLYAMLSNDGQLRPLAFFESRSCCSRGELLEGDSSTTASSSSLHEQPELLSAEAAFIVRDMLRQNPRPDFATLASTDAQPVSWKTGTSWSFRDAWSAGVVGPYVLVVWMGNFDGKGNPALIGIDAAAPLFFSIIDALRAAHLDLNEPSRRWPLNLRRVEICRASGDLPNVHCPKRGSTWFVPGVSPIRVSRVHRAIAVDIASGKPVCGKHDPRTVRSEIYEFWPSDLAEVFAKAGIPRRKPPAGAQCAGAQDWQGSAPRISSPLRGTRYALRLKHPEQNHLALEASADADVARLYWFADDSYLGDTVAGIALNWTPPRAGNFGLRVVDDHGRVAVRAVEVILEQ